NGIVVIGGVPVPIEIPVIGVEGGIAGMARGIGVGKFIIGGGLGYSGGSLTAGGFTQLNMGVAADLFLGAYAQMDVWGENFCRLYWEPLLWHGDIAGFFNIMAGVSIGPGPSAMVISTASLGTLPFNQFDLALSREGFSDDCPIKDKVCQLMGNLGLFPSQNGGVWSETGPWGPGARLLGPHQVYQRFPGGGRTAKCRGACGVDCDTCKHHPVHKITDPATGEVWEYTDFEDCNSNTGCREHDAAFDWAQVTKGESGKWAMIMPWHMAANIECGCNTVALNCPAWALGLPPYDKKIFFATTATKITTPGPGPGPVPGPGPEPGGVPSGNEELDLERCDRNELPPEFCEELYNRVIERYGNRDRDLDFDPDAELDGHRFPEDAPILDRFRAIYNRLDSWNVYIATNHTEWFGEFTTEFGVERKRTEWMNAIKEETKEFKKRFRDIGNADPEGERRRFERETLEKYEQKIDDLVHEIAVWYKNKTGSTESIEEIIERIHREGTELWRAAWRAAILEINRILSRIWPPAKAGLESWIGGERSRHPGIDLSGSISEIDYIGSLAKGYKSPSKQFVRFNPDNFDVDAFLLAPPLSKWALNFASGRHDPDFIDKGRIWGRASAISLLISFADLAHREFSSVQGYDTSEIFDVVLRTPGTPQQDRHRLGSDRLYALRESLSYERYQQLLSDLRDANLMETDPEGRLLLRDNLSATEDEQLNEILNRYET
ncbi:MAG TPA: hypothetical protein VFM60_05190, partial [Salinimicrobium sp.]|nr:hypothetical protein [Salinimicrobium sp.]